MFTYVGIIIRMNINKNSKQYNENTGMYRFNMWSKLTLLEDIEKRIDGDSDQKSIASFFSEAAIEKLKRKK